MASKNEDLRDPLKTPLDLFALLDIHTDFTNPATPPVDTSTFKRSYRRAALKWHPDKQGNVSTAARTAAAQKFEQIGIAHDILTSDTDRAIYLARRQREAKSATEKAQYNKKRKSMMEELERRESSGREGFLSSANGLNSTNGGEGLGGEWGTPTHAGVKRTFSARSTPLSQEKEAEMRRLAAEGAQRREAFEERRRRKRNGGEGEVEEVKGAPVEDPDGTPLQGAGGFAATPTRSENGNRAHATPSFSFSPGLRQPAQGRSESLGQSPGAPGGSLFESTMAKLREAQRRKEEAAKKQQEQEPAAVVE